MEAAASEPKRRPILVWAIYILHCVLLGCVVRDDGKVKFIESKDWGAGRGALLGGAIGIIGGPIGILAGGSIGALVSKLRDSGFKNEQLEQLGKSLQPNTSAIVVEIAGDAEV